MSDHSRIIVVVLSAVGIVIVILYCQRDRVTIDLTKEVRQLQEQTIPHDTSLPASAELVRGEFTAHTEWTFTTDVNARQYFEWLKQHLPLNYVVIRDSPTEIVLARQSAGDVCTLTLLPTSTESKTIVAKFRAGPD